MDPTPVAHLMDELVEYVLVCVPPEDPASLVRAALVCKHWCRIISGPSFCRMFHELHRKPPCSALWTRACRTDFVPDASSSFRAPHAAARACWGMLDARHGRVLFYDYSDPWAVAGTKLVDRVGTVTDGTWRIPMRPSLLLPWSAAVLCAAPGCDHLDCHGGPFLVVVVNTCLETRPERKLASAYVYSSEEGAWSNRPSMQHQGDCIMAHAHDALVGNALYFVRKILSGGGELVHNR